MTIGTFLEQSIKQLKGVGIDSARLDCLLLLEDALMQDRAHLLAHLEAEIPTKTGVELNTKIAQRSKHVPLAYIRGHTSFYGRDFLVSPDVLVPRPETESMIDLAKAITLPKNPVIVDVGTGSGCVGLTLAAEIPESRVWLFDIDKKALAVARQNAKKLGIKATFARQNLLPAEPRKINVLTANLPYVPTDLPINKAAHFEPKIALFSGSDGLDLYRELWQQLADHPASHVIIEALPSQHTELQKLAQKAAYQLMKSEGFAQHFSLSAPHRA
jgi:release factor glutamine methyltransferase